MAFKDFSQNNFELTAFGNAQISTAQKKYGDASAFFNSNGYALVPASPALDMGTGDFTIEYWAYVRDNTKDYPAHIATTASYQQGVLGIGFDRMDHQNKIWMFYDGVETDFFVQSSALTPNQWYHIALTREGQTWRGFVDGVQFATQTINQSNTVNLALGGAMGIGGNSWDGADSYTADYIADIRVTKGVARYTSNFTPPQTKLSTTTDPYYSSVVLLLPMNLGPFTDSSTNNFELTAFGNADLSTAVKKYGTAAGYFDGTGDYLQTINNSAFNFSEGPFTIEMWVNPNPTQVSFGGANGNAGAFISTRTSAIFSPLEFSIREDLKIQILVESTGGNSWQGPVVSNAVLAANTWSHIALVYNGSVTRLFINGVLDSNFTSVSFSYKNQNNAIYIGSGGDGNFNGYIDDLRITKGVARYTSNFTPPQQQLPKPSDPYQDNVSLLLHMDQNQFVDLSYNNFAITPFGNAKSSTQVVKYGDTAAYFDGTGDYIAISDNISLNFNTTDDFTIEGWIRFNSLEDGVALVSKGTNLTSSGWTLYYYQGLLYFGRPYISNDISGTFTPSLNTWYHLACTRNSGTIRLFVDGVQISSASNSLNYTTTENLSIGRSHSDNFLNGYTDDIRITKGVARYTTTFTPPSAQLPTIEDPEFNNVSLLLRTNRPFTDSSSNNFALSAFGDAQISTSTKKFGSGAGYFDGNGDYLELASNNSFLLDGDFTIEMWVKCGPQSSFYPSLIGSMSPSWQVGGASIQAHHQTLYPNKFSLFLNGNDTAVLVSTSTSTDDAWKHLAITKSGNTWRMFVDGVLENTNTTRTDIVYLNTNGTRIGWDGWNGSNGYFNGYIDDLRITKGVARYTSNFIPQTAPFSNPPITVPLNGLVARFMADKGVTESGGGIITSWTDQSGNEIVATPFGNPTIITNQLNGRPAVSFNDAEYFTFNLNSTITGPRTYIIIGRYRNPEETSQQGFLGAGYNSSYDLGYVFKNSNENRAYFYNGAQIRSPNITLIPYHVATVVHNGIPGSNFYRINGNTSTQVDYGTMTIDNVNKFIIGARGPDSEMLRGEIVEILIYNRQLSIIEIEQIESYAKL